MASVKLHNPSQRSSMLKFNPPRMMCRWLSIKSGSARRQRTSMIFVAGPASGINSLAQHTS
jgi:hypothetical protein